MPQYLSPGVNVTEYDLTTIIPAVSSTTACIAGPFLWGPASFPVLIGSETDLIAWYMGPTDFNAQTWFCAANFLLDGYSLYVNRRIDGAQNAIAHSGGSVSNAAIFLIKNETDYYNAISNNQFTAEPNGKFIGRYPGALGNSLLVSICPSANAYQQNFTIANCYFTVGSKNANLTFADVASANAAWQQMSSGDIIQFSNSQIGRVQLQVKNPGNQPSTNTIQLSLVSPYTKSVDFTGATKITRMWQFQNYVSGSPGQSQYQAAFGNTSANDEMHIVVCDSGGYITGRPIQVLEVYEGVSRATDAQVASDGSGGWYVDKINQNSDWVWWTNHIAGLQVNTAVNLASCGASVFTQPFDTGGDGNGEANMSQGNRMQAYDIFTDKDRYDISMVIGGISQFGVAGEGMTNYLVQNIAEVRKDCVVLASPPANTVINNARLEAQSIQAWSQNLVASNYLIVDSGYGWYFDKYNNKYRWVPLNGGTGGIIARTDIDRDPWWSPAGYNRGQYKNVTKLAYNPTSQADRDLLFQSFVNPVVTFPGQGTILYGDRTFAGKSSAFDAINVRRLFIVLEKAISAAAKFQLFEFNDEFTRAAFVNMVTPYLRRIQGLRGITDFDVICDETNNTPDIIDANQFVGSIIIEPARAIRNIQLNFVAAPTGVDFTTITGQIAT